MINIKLDGRDLPALPKKPDCLKTNEGCCHEQSDYFDKKSICFIKKGLNQPPLPSSGLTYFSFFTDEASARRENSAVKNLNLINVQFLSFISINSYASLISIGGGATCNLRLENVTITFSFFSEAPILFFKEFKTDFFFISNVSVSQYDPFFTKLQDETIYFIVRKILNIYLIIKFYLFIFSKQSPFLKDAYKVF